MSKLHNCCVENDGAEIGVRNKKAMLIASRSSSICYSSSVFSNWKGELGNKAEADNREPGFLLLF